MQAVGKERFRQLLSPRPLTFSTADPDNVKATISPLAGAAFSSNWVLFREVYDCYEKLAGCCWLRETVRARQVLFPLASKKLRGSTLGIPSPSHVLEGAGFPSYVHV